MSYSNYYKQHCEQRGISINEKFIDWIDTIESNIYNKCSLCLLDLPDEPYMYYFENNKTIMDVTNKILLNNFGTTNIA